VRTWRARRGLPFEGRRAGAARALEARSRAVKLESRGDWLRIFTGGGCESVERSKRIEVEAKKKEMGLTKWMETFWWRGYPSSMYKHEASTEPEPAAKRAMVAIIVMECRQCR